MRRPGLARCAVVIALFSALLVPAATVARAGPLLDELILGPQLEAIVALSPEAVAGGSTQEPIELFRVRGDTRMCPAPFCGGAFVSRVNQPDTHCADGEYRDSCYVTRVDLDPVDLTDPQLAHIYSALYTGQVLLGGRIEQIFSPTWGLFGEFRATDVWRSATDAVEPSVVFRARDNGVRCFAAPCYSYDLAVANTAELMTVSDLSLSNVGAAPEMLAAANESLVGMGLLVSGTMHEQPAAGPAGDGRLFDATQFYIPITRGIIIPPLR
jgi:hypothetical protein